MAHGASFFFHSPHSLSLCLSKKDIIPSIHSCRSIDILMLQMDSKRVSLESLEIEILIHISTFLCEGKYRYDTLPNAIIGAALPPSSTFRKYVSTKDWSRVDLSNFTGTKRLTDWDLEQILQTINAAETVQTLLLSYCFKIQGWGLAPLRGSKMIRYIDLSMKRTYYDVHMPKRPGSPKEVPLLAQEHVLPILDSIISDPENQLHCVKYPRIWRDNKKKYYHLLSFMMTFNDVNWMKRCKSIFDLEENFIDVDFFSQCRVEEHNCPFCVGSDVRLHIDACGRCHEYSVPSPLCCRHCSRFLCAGCADVDYCAVCKELNCDFCSFVRRCEKCTKPVCNECHKEAYGSTCPKKNCLCHSLCDTCSSEIKDSFVCAECIPSEYCFGCCGLYCRKCTTVTGCDLCDSAYCVECRQVWKCESCERLCCGTCSIVNMNDTCTMEWKCIECS